MTDKPVLLRQKGSKESKPFPAAQAKALLDYPNTQWEEVADKGPVDSTPKAAPARPKKKAAAAKVMPAAAAPVLPEVDTTGQPNSI